MKCQHGNVDGFASTIIYLPSINYDIKKVIAEEEAVSHFAELVAAAATGAAVAQRAQLAHLCAVDFLS